MTTNLSPAYLEAARRRSRFRPLYWRIKLSSFIKKWRIWRRQLASKKVYPSTADCSVTEQLERATPHFQQHNWAFMEGIISPEFHQEIIANWPKRYYFDPPRIPEKSYNTGFRWLYGNPPDFRYSDPHSQYPTFVKLLNYLRSAEFAERIRRFMGVPEEIILYSVRLSDAGAGAEVASHKDGVQNDLRAKNFLNMIFFVTASGGKNSGGLILARDNNLQEVIFEPASLVNTVLVYNILADFYHGFPPIAPGKFRWVFNAQFCGREYLSS